MIDPSEIADRLRREWERRALGGVGAQPRVSLDWRAYFAAFCDAHGRFPLVYAGRLLFPDGWTYSATDHAGPEWPPPENKIERVRLCRNYWKLRASAVRKELPAARLRVDQLRQLIATRSVMPLQRTTTWDAEGGPNGAGQWNSNVGPVDVAAAEQRLAWLEEDLDLCARMIVDPMQTEESVQEGALR